MTQQTCLGQSSAYPDGPLTMQTKDLFMTLQAAEEQFFGPADSACEGLSRPDSDLECPSARDCKSKQALRLCSCSMHAEANQLVEAHLSSGVHLDRSDFSFLLSMN